MGVISELRTELHGGNNPFDAAQRKWIDTGYPFTNLRPDVIEAVLTQTAPSFWLEVGSMVGGSVIRTADILHTRHMPTEIVCIDPFCGDINAWDWETRPHELVKWQCLRLQDGRPTIYERFLANIAAAGHTDRVLPVHCTSTVGLRLLHRLFDNGRITSLPDVIYLDSAHEEGETLLEVSLCWSLLRAGGVLMGDDWSWPAVDGDVTKFARTIQVDQARTASIAAILGGTVTADGIVLHENQWLLMK
jgi:Methyltransferase domain